MEKVNRMSDEKKKHEEKQHEEMQHEEMQHEEETEVKEEDPLQILEEENTQLKEEVKKLQNEYYKAYADAENIRKRQQRDYELSMKYRIQSFAESILPAIDNLERALSDDSDDAKAYREGVEMIYEQILNALKQEGVTPINALNKPFDPNIHQALSTEEVEGVEPNIIVEEYQKGYMIKDRVLRASLVKVSE